MKTQQMSLGTHNVKPVIMDVKNINTEAKKPPTKSSTPKILLGETTYDNGFKTQKFSKIEL